MAKYDLSVAIIFKNEIRCLERCLKSLQPLRERLSLQIVMADTGSTDGSRAVAEKYADVLFDFPWINDFAAARNAVLDRCRGRWSLVIDCDEWLNKDIDELASFLMSSDAKKQDAAMLAIRNYSTKEFDQYVEINSVRLLNMANKPRYKGAIHEQPDFRKHINCRALSRTFLHHDGYVMLNDGSDEGKAKTERNLALLKQEKERNPDNLRVLLQYLDSAVHEPDYLETLRYTLNLIEQKKGSWELFGAPIFRTAVLSAVTNELPELEEWTRKAFELFPRSYFIRIDVNCFMFARAYEQKDYEATIRYGEAYLKACADLDGDAVGWMEISFGVLQRRSEKWSALVTCCVAQSYCYFKRYDQAVAALKKLRWDSLGADEIRGVLIVFKSLYLDSNLDVSPLFADFWDGLCMEVQSEEALTDRQQMFLETGAEMFSVDEGQTARPLWRMFLPLRDKCLLGDAAALLNAETTKEADAILTGIDDPAALPPAAFVHALKLGAEFPIPGKLLTTDQIAALAEKLLIDPPFLREAARFAASAAQTEQEVMWAYALAKVALNQATAELEQKREEDAL